MAYLSVLAHHRNREQQGQALRAMALDLRAIVDPIPLPLPPSRSEAAAEQRAAKIEVLKDRWNDEIGRAAHWVQTTDWDEARGDMQAQVGALWSRILGETPAQSVEHAASTVVAGGKAVVDSARTIGQRANAELRSAEEAAQNKALEARLQTRKKTGGLIGSEAEATKTKEDDGAGAGAQQTSWGFLSSWFGDGKKKAAELVSGTKKEVASGTAGTADGVTLTKGSSAVEKALHQRYEKHVDKGAKTVAEALKERYIPIDNSDNSNLRGL